MVSSCLTPLLIWLLSLYRSVPVHIFHECALARGGVDVGAICSKFDGALCYNAWFCMRL